MSKIETFQEIEIIELLPGNQLQKELIIDIDLGKDH